MGVPKIGWFMMDSPSILVCPGWCKGVPLYMEHSTKIVMFLLTPFHRCSTNLRRYCQESTRWTSVKQLCRDIHETSDGQLMDDEDNEDVFFVCVCVKKCKLHENVINHDFLGHTIFRQAQIESYRSIQGCWGKLGNGKLWQIHQHGVFGSFRGLLANCLRMIELLLAQDLGGQLSHHSIGSDWWNWYHNLARWTWFSWFISWICQEQPEMVVVLNPWC